MPSPSTAQVNQERMYSAQRRWQNENRPSSTRWQQIWSSRSQFAGNVTVTSVPWGLESYSERRAQLGANPQAGFNKVLYAFDNDLRANLPASSGDADLGRTVYALMTSTSLGERYDRTDKSVFIETLFSWVDARQVTT